MMASLNYKIEVFEGPMDLLLHLISKHKLNIYDIPIVELVEQYLDYVNEMKNQDLEIASEFLDMAARLVYIKTVSLLPVYEEGDKLRQELSGELIEYAECKRVAQALATQADGFNCISRPQSYFEVDMTYTRVHESLELLNAYMRVVGKRLRKIPPPFDSFKAIVVKKIVSVSDKIKGIVSLLSEDKKHKFTDIISLSESRSDMVAAFLAILELAKTKHIYLSGDGENMEIELIKVPEGELDFD